MFLMSLAQFILVASWLISANYKSRINLFLNNKLALIFSGVFLIHLLGLLYTEDLSYALQDIRIKLPLLIFPFIISTSQPLSKKHLTILMYFFILSIFIATLISTGILLGYIEHSINDIRDISVFISHIRFSLLICMAIFGLLHFILFRQESKPVLKIIYGVLIIWFVVFLVILESITGLAILFVLSLLLLLYVALKQKNIYLKSLIVLSILSFIALLYFGISNSINGFYKRPINHSEVLDKSTPRGNAYEHILSKHEVENGYPVWQYVCWSELAESWNKRSSIDFEGKDEKKQEIKYTIIRFLTSKGLRKDADGINKLSAKEVQAIERGIANVTHQDLTNFKVRINKIIWEYNNYINGGNPSGHSVMQRLEFWKAALAIIKKNLLLGVGTGDIKMAFDQQYKEMNSPLTDEWRLRSHNQYLSFMVAFGIIGGIYFLISLLYPFVFFKHINYFYMVFWIIAVLSMLTEDTLETQAGVTFFAFFNSLFLFNNNRNQSSL